MVFREISAFSKEGFLAAQYYHDLLADQVLKHSPQTKVNGKRRFQAFMKTEKFDYTQISRLFWGVEVFPGEFFQNARGPAGLLCQDAPEGLFVQQFQAEMEEEAPGRVTPDSKDIQKSLLPMTSMNFS